MTVRAETGTDSTVAARAAAIASAGAAVIHLAVTPTHWRDWVLSGIFFASVAVFQLIWAVLAWTRPPVVLLAAAIVANSGLAVLWVWSRTLGEPFGPNAGELEAVHAAGICALLLECYVVMGSAWAWLRHDRAESVSRLQSALVLLTANTVVAAAVAVGLASSLQGHYHHPAPAEAQGEHQAPQSDPTDGQHNQSETVTKLDARVTQPPAAPVPTEPALPQTDSSHDANGDHHHDG